MDEEGFARLVERHARIVASAIRRVCGARHRSLIPDVEQEVQVALWKRLRGGKDIEHPASYLYKVALTTAVAMVQKEAGQPQALDEMREIPDTSVPASFRSLLPAEQACLVAEVLGKLPPDESRAVRAHLAGFGHVEVARLFGWTESVARHRIYRGIDLLRRQLRDADAGTGKR